MEVFIQVEVIFGMIIQIFESFEVAVTSESNLGDDCDGKEMRMHCLDNLTEKRYMWQTLLFLVEIIRLVTQQNYL